MGGAAPVPKPGERPTLHKKQLPKLLFLTLSRWLVTASIIGAIYGVLVHYYNLAAMTNSQKRVFNAVIVSLTISLALNIASSLKAMAGELRWWVLSLRHWPIREVSHQHLPPPSLPLDVKRLSEKLTRIGGPHSSKRVHVSAVQAGSRVEDMARSSSGSLLDLHQRGMLCLAFVPLSESKLPVGSCC